MHIHDARRLTSTAMALILGAFFVSVPSIQASAQSQQRPTLSAQQCSPLSDENYEICCIALKSERHSQRRANCTMSTHNDGPYQQRSGRVEWWRTPRRNRRRHQQRWRGRRC